MAKRSLSERLNQAVEAILGDPRAAALSVDPSLASFAPVIAGLRDLPSDAFRETLRQDLIRRATMTATTTAQATKRVSPIREGFHTITPYLQVFRAAELIDFVKSAFGAEERFRSTGTGSAGGIHAEVRIGDSMVMLGEPMGPFPSMPAQAYLYVKDCDAVYRSAIQAGATPVMEPTTMEFSGERYGGVKDPSGNIWWVATHVEDVTPEECARRLRHGSDNLRRTAL